MNVCFCDKTPFPIKKCKDHSHKQWEIIYNLSGENISKIGENIYSIKPGDIMIIPPGILHSGASDGVYADIYVQAKEIDFNEITVIHDYDGNILTLFNMLHRIFWQRENNYSKICDSILDLICQYSKKYTTQSYRHTFIYEIKDFIYENISNPDFKISDISAYVGYDIDYVRRSFYSEIGQTPSEYLTNLRVSLAKKLLLQESFITVKDVAAKCGFSDSFYFSTLFKKKTNFTPLQYRKQFLK